MSRKCLYPFTNLTVNPNGSVAPCCKYNVKKGEPEISKDSLYDKNIHELFYQPAMNSIREKFNNGIEPKECEVCWDEEAAGITSMRQHRNNHAKWSNHSEKYVNRFEDPKMVTLDFKFSSLCNLKCRICGPYCSSNWLKEAQDTNLFHEHTIKIFSKYAERKFVNNEENFKAFKELIPNLHIVEFYGGEPLMQPEHAKIMDILNNYEGIENCKLDLYYNTNGTIYDEQSVEIWKKMGVIELNISIDDTGKRFEYQRHPAKWEEVVSNIKKYQANCSENVRIHLYCTVSLYNIFYIDELIKFNAEHLKTELRFNLLHWPPKMSVKNLPQNIKEIVKTKIENLKTSDKSFTEKSFVSSLFDIDQVINYMMNTERSDEELQDFIKTTNTHDDYRQQSFKDTFTEYWNLINGNN